MVRVVRVLRLFPVRKPIFDDKRSLLHFIIGFVSAFTLAYSLIIILLYTLYQIRERENWEYTVSDVVEFVLGYVYGLAVLVWLKLKGVV